MKERKKPATSFSKTDWAVLREALESDDSAATGPESAVLLVMLCTGIRIGDVLRIERAALKAALADSEGAVEVIQKGGKRRMIPVSGAEHAWRRLLGQCAEGGPIANSICPTSTWGAQGGGGAYQRVNRHLHKLAGHLGLSGRPHLHRLRRTVATNALGLTKDIHLVGNLLGHRSVRSTEHYLDEARDEEVAVLQRRLLGE